MFGLSLRRAGLHADQARWLLGEELHQLRAPDLPPNHDLARRIHPVHLVHRLSEIQTNRDYLPHRSPPLSRSYAPADGGEPSTASIADVARQAKSPQSALMNFGRLVVALGSAALILGVGGQTQAEGLPRPTLIVPADSPVRLRTLSKEDLSAEFTGSFVLSGTFRYGCTDECRKPFARQDMRLDFFPDAELLARLPRWSGQTGHPEIEIENSATFAAKVIPQATMRTLQYGHLNWVEGRISIVVDRFRTGIACDATWYSARFVEVAKPAVFVPVHSVSEGCE